QASAQARAFQAHLDDRSSINVEDIVQPIGIRVVVTIDHRHLSLQPFVFLILFAQAGESAAQTRSGDWLPRMELSNTANFAVSISRVSLYDYLSQPSVAA